MSDPSSPQVKEHVYRFCGNPDETEYVENYYPTGYHPISIGDCFANNRYRILHKLGSGASATVWLARDQHYTNPGKLVALKAHSAYSSTPEHNHELEIQDILRDANPPIPYIQTVEDHFFVDGLNGNHLFLIYPLGGPSLFTMHDEARKQLRGDLARKVIKQVVLAVEGLHRVGVIHGGITTKNIIFALKPHVIEWTDEEVYDILGKPKTFKVQTNDGTPLPPCVPAELIYPVRYNSLMSPNFLEEKIILADFGQSYPHTIRDFIPYTKVHYFAPEVHFENRAHFEADVWGLACTIYEIFSGRELFSSFFGSISDILADNVAILGRFPDPWWEKYEDRDEYFLENGEPKLIETDGEKDYDITKSSIREELRNISAKLNGCSDEAAPRSIHRWPQSEDLKDSEDSNDELEYLVKSTSIPEDLQIWKEERDETMFEKTKVRFSEREVEVLGDLLERMLKLHPDDRIGIREVMDHPWLKMAEV